MADKPRMELSASHVLGGALAAASAAVAASLLGVYGTVIGAAVVSVVASIGSAVYTHSFQRGRQVIGKVRENRTGQMTRVVDGDPPPDDTPTETTDTTEPSGAAGADRKRPGWRARLAAVNPKPVAVTAVCILVLSLGSILFVETLIDKPISSALGHGDGGGGTTLSRLSGGDSPATERQDRLPKTTPTATPTTTVTESESPTEEPTERPTSGPTSESTTSEPETSEPTLPPTSSEPTTDDPSGTSSGGSTDGDGTKLQAPRE